MATVNKKSVREAVKLPAEVETAIGALTDRLPELATTLLCPLGILLNFLERLFQRNVELEDEVQRLRDEVNRLKGEKPDPKRGPRNPPKKSGKGRNISSEKERKQGSTNPPSKRGPKRELLPINETVPCSAPKEELPADAVYKGVETKVVQDLHLKPHVLCFNREKYYSPSLGKTYLAPLPLGFDYGDLGPTLVSYIHFLHWQGQVSQPNIFKILDAMGVVTSEAKISSLLTKRLDAFHEEKDEVHKAGLESSAWQQIDDTTGTVNGHKCSAHVLCNPLYSFYLTRPDKSRLSVLDVLRNIRDTTQRRFRVNDEAFALLETELRVKHGLIEALQQVPQEVELSAVELLCLLNKELAERGTSLSFGQQRRILDATAIASYHAMTDYPIVRLLICDDASQFKLLTEDLLLCWIHEGRHYKKLIPFLAVHQGLLDSFLDAYWAFYKRLLVFRKEPTQELADQLQEAFLDLFSTQTGYADLDARIAKTKEKIGRLLFPVLSHPEIPLHNNGSEQSIRVRVRKRDVSFGPRSAAGQASWDTFLTLCETTRKLGVSFWDFLKDRFTKAHRIPRLGQIIAEKARENPPDPSWASER